MTNGTPTAQQQAGQILHTLLAQLGGDVLASTQGLLTTFFTNVKQAPSVQTVVAQGLALAATAPLQLPNLEAQSIAQFADAGLQLTALIPEVTAPPPATPAPAG